MSIRLSSPLENRSTSTQTPLHALSVAKRRGLTTATRPVPAAPASNAQVTHFHSIECRTWNGFMETSRSVFPRSPRLPDPYLSKDSLFLAHSAAGEGTSSRLYCRHSPGQLPGDDRREPAIRLLATETTSLEQPQDRPMTRTIGRIALLAVISAETTAWAAERFGVVLQGGRVVDGTGSPWYVADVSTGSEDPRMASFDRMIRRFLQEHHVPGAALAVTDAGRLLSARRYRSPH